MGSNTDALPRQIGGDSMKHETYPDWPLALALGFIMAMAFVGGLIGFGLSKVLFKF